jgi:Flp pilus assembly protein TadG
MQCARLPKNKRRGAVAPLAAVLMIVLLGMVAFAVDIGWIGVAQSELQNAADAAALAGAGQLMSPSVQFSLPQQTTANQTTILSAAETSAKTYAKNFASYNRAGSASSLVLLDNDIEFGFTDSSGNYTTYTGSNKYAASFPNTIKVTLRLDNTQGGNGPLSLFFGSVFGTSSTNLTATASATIYAGTVNNLSAGAHILPMTVDVNVWNNYLATGLSGDGLTHLGSNGLPQLELFPSSNLGPGNLGYLSLDDSSNSSSSISTWLQNGLSASDVQTLQQNQLLPLSQHSSTQWDWKGEPGFKSADLNSLPVGGTYLLPLFKPVVATPGPTYQATVGTPGPATVGSSGAGSNAYYQIVQFVGVTITQLDKSTDVWIQPAAVSDPSMVLDPSTIKPVVPGSSSQLATTFAPPKLSQ